jgi:dCTP deaminase
MTILNDMEIRQRCLTPTHRFGSHPGVGGLYHRNGDDLYSLGSGERYKFEGDFITELVKINENIGSRMISPFCPDQVRVDENGEKIISYGTSSMGYDVRLDRKFKIFTNVYGDTIDPLNMSETMYVDYEGDSVIIPPNSYILGVTIETFNIPRDILAVCLGKSTYARCAGICNVTPIEPGFSGNVVIEVANLSTLPLKVYAGQGIAQFLFLQGNPCETSYGDRGGKYQNQSGIQTALV